MGQVPHTDDEESDFWGYHVTNQQPPYGGFDPQQPMYVQQPMPVRKKKIRVFSWIILAINALFLIWLITGIATVSNSSCSAGTTVEGCESAKALGGGIGAILIILLWVAADVILGIIWLVTRKKEPTIVYVQQPPPPRA